MIFYLLCATLWVHLDQGDGTMIECATDQAPAYFPDVRLLHIRECGDRIFTDGFEEVGDVQVQ